MSTKKIADVVRSLINTHTDAEIAQVIGRTKSAVLSFCKRNNIARNSSFRQDLLKEGFDGDNWSHGWLKTDKSSIFIKNDEGFMSYEDIKDELIAEMRKYAPKYPTMKYKPITDKHALIISIADPHFRKLALYAETSEEYNIEIAKKRCIDGVMGILQKSQGFPIDKIILVIGNDALHTEGITSSTTAGTPQDVSTTWWSAYLEAQSLYVRIIEMLFKIAPLEIVFCPSNHDTASGFMLANSLSAWFHNTSIKFHVSIKHRKYLEYGSNMLAFDHGDGAKEHQTKALMADEEPKMWSRTKYRYAYKGHIHHYKKISYVSGEDFIGVTVEFLRSPSASDAWHRKHAFIAPKAIEGFIHSKDKGQVAKITHYFN